MRGGTSRGPFFLRSDLPAARAQLSKVLLAVMGSPHDRQIDGLGGATPLTSKVAIVSPAKQGPAQIDYLFAQIAIDQASVDYGPTCGNMLAGVGPFAIDAGLVPADDGETRILIRAVNTNALIEATVQTPGRRTTYEGDARIHGVPGTAAPVILGFRDLGGEQTGALLPTGNAQDTIDGIAVTCLDAAMPVVIARAQDLGKGGHETAAALTADSAFMTRIEHIRRQAGLRMGMGDVAGRVIPKFAIVAASKNDGAIASRYFTPQSCHPAHAVTGAICVAVSTAMAGTVVAGLGRTTVRDDGPITLEHPAGTITIGLSVDGKDRHLRVRQASIMRTTRRLMAGEVYIPSNLWSPA